MSFRFASCKIDQRFRQPGKMSKYKNKAGGKLIKSATLPTGDLYILNHVHALRPLANASWAITCIIY